MSSFGDEELVTRTNVQAIHDWQMYKSFDNLVSLETLQIGVVILRFIGFGVVIVIGFNLIEAYLDDRVKAW
jgi:hypothetical protein